jgi:hypothetical protein
MVAWAAARVRRKRCPPSSKRIEDTIRPAVGLSVEPGPIRFAPHMIEIADAEEEETPDDRVVPSWIVAPRRVRVVLAEDLWR